MTNNRKITYHPRTIAIKYTTGLWVLKFSLQLEIKLALHMNILDVSF